MSETLLIPQQASAPSATNERKPFDLKAHARTLRDTPKEHYQEAVEPEPPPTPKDAPPTGDPGTGAPGGEGPGDAPGEGEPTQKHRDAAKTAFDMYDTIAAKVAEGMVGNPKSYPAEHFRMDTHTRSQAEYQLARGIAAGGGKFTMPWWTALSMLMAFQGFMTWQQVKKAKSTEEERATPPSSTATQRDGGPASRHDAPLRAVYPDSVIDAKGRTTPLKMPSKQPKEPCQHCGAPVKHKGRKYCSQSCAGKATSSKRRVKPTTPTTPTTEAQ